MEGLVNIIEEFGIEEVIDEDLGFIETETLYETEERILPSDNDSQPTIEVYSNDTVIWENVKS